MSLLDQASLIVTPNGYKASKLYSVKPTDASGDMVVSRNTTSTRVNSSNLIESVAINVPRLDYTLGSCPSILVEPARTNLVLRSEEFDNIYWSKFNATVSANASASADGTTTADLVYPSSTGSLRGQVFRALTGITLGDVVTVSVFVKASGKNFAYIAPLYNFSPAAYFNLSTAEITSHIPNVTTSMTAFANGWWRISVTSTATATSFISIGSTDDALGSNMNTASGTNGILLWGAQVEVGSSQTSYISTTAATVTRNADLINKTGVSSLIGQTEGTIYAEIKVTKLLGAASRYVFHLSDGTANNRIYIAFSGSDSNVLRARIFSGGTLQCSINSSALTSTGTYKLAMAYKNNDIVFYINGIQIGTDTSATIPTCSKVDLGHNQGGASQFNDGINNANIWKTRLTNAQLATLTTL